MSFRLFIYYCALCGGWSGFAGWLCGRLLTATDVEGGARILRSGVRGLFLGLMIAFGLSLLDALWNLSLRRFGQVLLRVLVAVAVGAVGGFVGGMLAEWLYGFSVIFFVLGWTLCGLLAGMSVGVFEFLAAMSTKGSSKKMIKALIGGTLGGLLGGILALLLQGAWTKAFSNEPGKTSDWLWSPTCWGFVALGMCIGLLVGLAQIILREAWIKVEAGFRPGREMLLSKEKTTIGRAEACDLGLFGDNLIEKLHAQIVLDAGRYFIEDAGTPGGTYVNDRPVGGRTPLNSGDLIRVGKSMVRFNERQKRTA